MDTGVSREEDGGGAGKRCLGWGVCPVEPREGTPSSTLFDRTTIFLMPGCPQLERERDIRFTRGF